MGGVGMLIDGFRHWFHHRMASSSNSNQSSASEEPSELEAVEDLDLARLCAICVPKRNMSLPVESHKKIATIRAAHGFKRRKASNVAGAAPGGPHLPKHPPRLSFRLLARFATVCKEWRDVILHDAAFARVQAQSPTPASAGLARFYNGRFEVLTPGSAAVAPPDPSLSFLTVDAGQRLELCACTNGLLCLTAPNDSCRTFFVVNPATREFHAIPYAGEGDLRACLAYDPETAHREGYHLVVAASQDSELYRFWRFSSREGASGGWRASREALRLPPFEKLQPKPTYVGGRVHWLSHRGDVVWHAAAADLAGKLAPPGKKLSSGEHFEGNRDLVAWRGQLGLVCASMAGLGVWALAGNGGGSSPARWEMVHWRIWDEIPGVVRPLCCFLWSVVPAGMEAGGEEAVGLAVRTAQMAVVAGELQQLWHRAVLRYDLRTGATVTALELSGKEVHDDLGPVFGYHSSMAALPMLNLAA